MTPAVEQATQSFMQTANGLSTLYTFERSSYELLVALESTDDPEEVANLERHLTLIDQMMLFKTEGYVSVMRELKSRAETRKAESDALAKSAARADRNYEWLKARLLNHMQVIGRPRIETGRFTIAIAKNPPSVDVFDPAMVPSEFQRTTITTEVDKVAVRKHTKTTGEIVPGTRVVRTENLRIS